AGWNTRADGTGTNYGPNETVSISDLNTIANNDLASEGAILYANWIPAEKDYTMQTFNQSICEQKLNVGEVMALRDIRDDNVYTIARLPMGWDSTNNTYASSACWMIENLRLGKEDNVILTSIDTDTLSNFTLSGASDVWCTDADAASGPTCINQPKLNISNVASAVSNMSDANSNVYSYGAYYNWYATTTGGGTYSISADAQHITASLCPSNWFLPQGGNTTNRDNSDFYKLGKAMANGDEPESMNQWNQPYYVNKANLFRSYPYNFVLSGNWRDRHTASRSTYGFYWTSSNATSSQAYDLVIQSPPAPKAYPGTYNGPKYVGYTIRCLASN
ncbi:hypothetical protein IKE79_01540, partial [Candidatus Saccharibacteria bacterium]|nr:hypothetical protein [Candidatus Saccharibacteria bacterium]